MPCCGVGWGVRRMGGARNCASLWTVGYRNHSFALGQSSGSRSTLKPQDSRQQRNRLRAWEDHHSGRVYSSLNRTATRWLVNKLTNGTSHSFAHRRQGNRNRNPYEIAPLGLPNRAVPGMIDVYMHSMWLLNVYLGLIHDAVSIFVSDPFVWRPLVTSVLAAAILVVPTVSLLFLLVCMPLIRRY